MPLDLAIFTADPSYAERAIAAGIDRVVVDWETAGKAARQAGYSTQVNQDSPQHVRAHSERSIPVLVRIDHQSRDQVEHDVALALDCGAESIMLPMARDAKQVQAFVDAVAGRARTIVQIETQELVDDVSSLQQIGWDLAYVGLNDLMISRGEKWIWRPMIDGTIDYIYNALPERKIGFGGVTVVGQGHPLPFTALLSEMARLGCSMSFLRRSFLADIAGRDIVAEIKAIRALWQALRSRDHQAVATDHQFFCDLLKKLDPQGGAPSAAT